MDLGAALGALALLVAAGAVVLAVPVVVCLAILRASRRPPPSSGRPVTRRIEFTDDDEIEARHHSR